jgi:radical SAM protein with 4Fe4S-binding SPASM domain
VNYIVHRNNYENLYEFASKLKDSGVENVRFSPMYTSDFYNYHAEIESSVNNQLSQISKLVDAKFNVNSTYNLLPGSSHSHFRAYKSCFVMQTVPVIGADLKIYACHNKAYDQSGCIGSIENQSFKELWFSPKTREFMRSFNAKKACMHECTNDRKNIILNDYINSSIDNFI